MELGAECGFIMFKRLMHGPVLERIQTGAFLFIMGFWRRTTLGARAMLVDGNKVLLIKHTYTSGWSFPGGGVEVGDSALATAKKELCEETGYRAADQGRILSIYHNIEASRRDHVVLFVFKEFGQAHPFTPSAEISEMGWFAIDDLPHDATDATLRRIEEFFSGAEISEIW